MAKLKISEIINTAAQFPDENDRINFLREHDNPALRQVLQYGLDANIKFLLPEGKVPYKPSSFDESRFILYNQARKLYLFVEGGNDNLSPFKREMIFVTFLESIDPEDAELICQIKDKKLPEGITAKVVNTAFGGLVNT